VGGGDVRWKKRSAISRLILEAEKQLSIENENSIRLAGSDEGDRRQPLS